MRRVWRMRRRLARWSASSSVSARPSHAHAAGSSGSGLVHAADTGITVFDLATHGERRIAATSRGCRRRGETGSGLAQQQAGVHPAEAEGIDQRERHVLGPRDLGDEVEGSRIVICIDADALDPALVPGVIGRAPGGLTYYQLVDLIKGAARRGRIEAMDFVEFMPERDVDGIGALTFARAITTALGVIARQRA